MKINKKLSPLLLLLSAMSCAPIPVSAFGNTTIKPVSYVELDTYGSNSDIYEYTPVSAPYMLCEMYMLDSGNDMGLQCFMKLEYQLFLQHPDKFPDPRTGKMIK